MYSKLLRVFLLASVASTPFYALGMDSNGGQSSRKRLHPSLMQHQYQSGIALPLSSAVSLNAPQTAHAETQTVPYSFVPKNSTNDNQLVTDIVSTLFRNRRITESGQAMLYALMGEDSGGKVFTNQERQKALGEFFTPDIPIHAQITLASVMLQKNISLNVDFLKSLLAMTGNSQIRTQLALTMFQKRMNLRESSNILNSLLIDQTITPESKISLAIKMFNNQIYPSLLLCDTLKILLNNSRVPSEDKIAFAKHLLNSKSDISMYQDVLINLMSDTNLSPEERIDLAYLMLTNNYNLKDYNYALQSLLLSNTPTSILLASEMLFRGFNLSSINNRLLQMIQFPAWSLSLRAQLVNNMAYAGLKLTSDVAASDASPNLFQETVTDRWWDEAATSNWGDNFLTLSETETPSPLMHELTRVYRDPLKDIFNTFILNPALNTNSRAILLGTLLLKKVDIGDRISTISSLGLLEAEGVNVLHKIRLARAYIESCFHSLSFEQLTYIKDLLKISSADPAHRVQLLQYLAFRGVLLQRHASALQELLNHPYLGANSKANIASLMVLQQIPIPPSIQLENFIGNFEVDVDEQIRLGYFILRHNLSINDNTLQILNSHVVCPASAPKLRANLASLLIQRGERFTDKVDYLLEFVANTGINPQVRADLASYILNVSPELAATHTNIFMDVISRPLELHTKVFLAQDLLLTGVDLSAHRYTFLGILAQLENEPFLREPFAYACEANGLGAEDTLYPVSYLTHP